MTYCIEISFNNLNNNELINTIKYYAYFYNCYNFYICNDDYIDNEYNKKPIQFVLKNNNYIEIYFLKNDIINCIQFLRVIKQLKNIFIQSVFDNNINKLIYANYYYLSKLNKFNIHNYKQFIKNNIFSNNEIKLLQIIKN